MSQPSLPDDEKSGRNQALVWTAIALGAAAGLVVFWHVARWIVGC